MAEEANRQAAEANRQAVVECRRAAESNKDSSNIKPPIPLQLNGYVGSN